jgi:hypothetical protein
MFLLPWLLAILLALLDEWVSTILLRCEYTHHRLAWESDGKPRGVFWIPDECRIGWYITYASGHAAQIVKFKWLLKTPDWMANNPQAHRLLTFHRLLMPSFVACLIAPFVIALLLQ